MQGRDRRPTPAHPTLGQALRQLPTQTRRGERLNPIRWFWLAAILTLALDLASKFLVFAALGDGQPLATANPPGNAIWLLPGALRLVTHYNTGGAFGLASGRLLLFLGATAVLVPALVLTAYHNREPDAPLWSLGLIVGGAVGNLHDRLFHIGVRDFLELIHPHTGRPLWPVFNLADVAIVVGVVIYLIWTILDHLAKRRQAAYDSAVEENEFH